MSIKNKLLSGFTIVELLIVIVVIGILASVTVVAYGGIQERAHDTAVQSDLRNAAQKLDLYKIDNGRYPTENNPNGAPFDIELELRQADLSFSHNAYAPDHGVNLLYFNDQAGNDFAIIARSKSGTVLYYSSKEGAVKEYTGSQEFPGEAYGGFSYELSMFESRIVEGYNEYSGWASWAE